MLFFITVFVMAGHPMHAQIEELKKDFGGKQQAYIQKLADIKTIPPKATQADADVAKADADKAFKTLIEAYNNANPPANNLPALSMPGDKAIDTATMRLYHELDHGKGAEMGGKVVCWTFWLTGIMMIILLIILARSGFKLKEALSENVLDKITEKNTTYDQLPDLIKNLNAPNSPLLTQLIQQAQNDQAAAVTACNDRKQKEQDLLSAPDDATKIQALDNAKRAEQAATAKADASAKAVLTLTLSPAMMANLGTLFPPTIEISASANMINVVSTATTGKNVSYRPSASRLIAFISAILLFIVGLASTCFFLYFYLVNGVAPDLSKLSAILIALGIGMAPYAVNKVANASTDKDKII